MTKKFHRLRLSPGV